MGPEARGAVKVLMKLLDDEPWNMRWLAARALGSIGKEAKSALPRLRESTSDRDARVRIQAVLAMWQIANDKTHVPLLARLLEDESVATREAAAQALTSMGGDAREATPALVKALTDTEPSVKQAAVVAIGSIGPSAKDAAASLRPLLKDADKAVRLHAAFALWQVTGEVKDTLDILRSLVSDPNLQVAAIARLGTLGPAARDILPDLVTMYREENRAALRRVVGDAIKKIDATLATKLGIR
jgi:HEAT repeat protein